MKDDISWLTPKKAAALIGYSARHIQNLITNGKLSATKEDGKYYIERSEFFRVFPKAHLKEQQGNTAQQIAEKERLEFENTMLKENAFKKEAEIEFLRKQVEFISQEKLKMLDTIVSTTKFLEYKSDKNKEESNKKRRNWKDFFKIK